VPAGKACRTAVVSLHLGLPIWMQWAPDTASVAVGSRRSEVSLWNIETGTLDVSLVGHTKSVYAVNYCGNRVVSGSADHLIKVSQSRCPAGDRTSRGSVCMGHQIWDTRTGECTTTFGFDGSGHSSSVLCVQNDGAYRVGGWSVDCLPHVLCE
jgi:hypothetical protein